MHMAILALRLFLFQKLHTLFPWEHRAGVKIKGRLTAYGLQLTAYSLPHTCPSLEGCALEVPHAIYSLM